MKKQLNGFSFAFLCSIIIRSVGLSAFQFMHFQSHCIVVNRTMALKSGLTFKVQSSNEKSDHSAKISSL